MRYGGRFLEETEISQEITGKTVEIVETIEGYGREISFVRLWGTAEQFIKSETGRIFLRPVPDAYRISIDLVEDEDKINLWPQRLNVIISPSRVSISGEVKDLNALVFSDGESFQDALEDFFRQVRKRIKKMCRISKCLPIGPKTYKPVKGEN